MILTFLVMIVAAALYPLGAAAAQSPGAVSGSPAAAPTISLDVQLSRQASTRPATPAGPAMSLHRTIPLPMIVAGLQAQMPYRTMNYIGVERFDPASGIYALRFLNGRQVIVVIVDGRTGRILDRGF
jgi:hypothetical protein